MDRCSPNPCQNRAICRARSDGYSCFCVPGFQGARCHIDVDECVSQPCRNGAACLDRVGRFSCRCSAGFTGERESEGFEDGSYFRLMEKINDNVLPLF